MAVSVHPPGMCWEHVLPCGQSLASALLTALPKHSGHGGKEGHGHGGTSHGGTPVLTFFLHSKKKHFIQVVSGWVFWEWRFFFPRVFHHICVFVSVTVYQCMCIWYPFCIRYILSEYMFLYLSYSHTLVISDHTFWPLRCCNTKLVSKCSREWLGPPNWKTERLGSIFWWWWISHLLGVNVVLFGDRPHLKIRDPSKVVTFKYI